MTAKPGRANSGSGSVGLTRPAEGRAWFAARVSTRTAPCPAISASVDTTRHLLAVATFAQSPDNWSNQGTVSL